MPTSDKTPYIGIHVRINPRTLDALVKAYQAQFPHMTITRSELVRIAIEEMAERELPKTQPK